MTTTAVKLPDPEVTKIWELHTGTLVEIYTDGRAEIMRCDWMLRVPSGHPEPDSEADCWTYIECGGRQRYIEDGQRIECEDGHRTGYTPEAAREEWEREQTERSIWAYGGRS